MIFLSRPGPLVYLMPSIQMNIDGADINSIPCMQCYHLLELISFLIAAMRHRSTMQGTLMFVSVSFDIIMQLYIITSSFIDFFN